MARRPYQVGTPKCGCYDCIQDFPPSEYDARPERDACLGKWQVRYTGSDRRQRSRNFGTLADANRFLASLLPEGVCRGA